VLYPPCHHVVTSYIQHVGTYIIFSKKKEMYIFSDMLKTTRGKTMTCYNPTRGYL